MPWTLGAESIKSIEQQTTRLGVQNPTRIVKPVQKANDNPYYDEVLTTRYLITSLAQSERQRCSP